MRCNGRAEVPCTGRKCAVSKYRRSRDSAEPATAPNVITPAASPAPSYCVTVAKPLTTQEHSPVSYLSSVFLVKAGLAHCQERPTGRSSFQLDESSLMTARAKTRFPPAQDPVPGPHCLSPQSRILLAASYTDRGYRLFFMDEYRLDELRALAGEVVQLCYYTIPYSTMYCGNVVGPTNQAALRTSMSAYLPTSIEDGALECVVTLDDLVPCRQVKAGLLLRCCCIAVMLPVTSLLELSTWRVRTLLEVRWCSLIGYVHCQVQRPSLLLVERSGKEERRPCSFSCFPLVVRSFSGYFGPTNLFGWF